MLPGEIPSIIRRIRTGEDVTIQEILDARSLLDDESELKSDVAKSEGMTSRQLDEMLISNLKSLRRASLRRKEQLVKHRSKTRTRIHSQF